MGGQLLEQQANVSNDAKFKAQQLAKAKSLISATTERISEQRIRLQSPGAFDSAWRVAGPIKIRRFLALPAFVSGEPQSRKFSKNL
mgnify:CR=1 FL=1